MERKQYICILGCTVMHASHWIMVRCICIFILAFQINYWSTNIPPQKRPRQSSKLSFIDRTQLLLSYGSPNALFLMEMGAPQDFNASYNDKIIISFAYLGLSHKT